MYYLPIAVVSPTKNNNNVCSWVPNVWERQPRISAPCVERKLHIFLYGFLSNLRTPICDAVSDTNSKVSLNSAVKLDLQICDVASFPSWSGYDETFLSAVFWRAVDVWDTTSGGRHKLENYYYSFIEHLILYYVEQQ